MYNLIKDPNETIEPIDTSTSYIGYYADIDGDGVVDGVIFADLAFSKSSVWPGSINNRGVYSYSAKSNLKQYYVSKKSYTDKFGTKPVLAPVKNTTGNDRFYVMALTQKGSYRWWTAAYGHTTAIISATDEGANDFGSGRSKTNSIMNAWNNNKYSHSSADIWGNIQTEYANGWFVASKSELSAFSHAFGITSSNYTSFGSPDSWSSSVPHHSGAYHTKYVWGGIDVNAVNNYYIPLRLATTF